VTKKVVGVLCFFQSDRFQATDFVSGMPTWGDQPIVAAPAYIGIVVFFLAIIACLLINERLNMYLPVRL
jgi:hypothetical protein